MCDGKNSVLCPPTPTHTHARTHMHNIMHTRAHMHTVAVKDSPRSPTSLALGTHMLACAPSRHKGKIYHSNCTWTLALIDTFLWRNTQQRQVYMCYCGNTAATDESPGRGTPDGLCILPLHFGSWMLTVKFDGARSHCPNEYDVRMPGLS